MVEDEPFCFWCGGNARFWFITNPRPLLDTPQPKPCASCESIRALGVAVYEVVEYDPGCGNPKVIDNVWFTGRWALVRNEDVPILFPTEKVAAVLETRSACLKAESYKSAHLDHYPWRTIQ